MNFGLIADGNRRWAKKNNLPTVQGHAQGFKVIRQEILPVLEKSEQWNAFTVYTFSTENWKRSPLEIKNLMNMFCDFIDDFLPELEEKKIKLIHTGRKNRIPKRLLQKITQAEKQTAAFNKFKIFLCLDYGGQDEIIRTAQKLSGQTFTEKKFIKELEVPTLDLIFRPGGESRLSNFCIFQAAYSELFFSKKFLPEIKSTDINEVLLNYNKRNQRKGK